MNDTTIRELQAESSDICVTEIVTISWEDGEKRLINNNEALTVNGMEYAPCGLSFNPPSGEGRDGELSVDDTDGELTYTLQLKDKASVSISLIDIDDPEEPLDGPVEFDVSSFRSSSDGTCTLTLSSRSRLSYGLSKLTYSTTIFPGLFG